MKGPLDMNGNKIINISSPVEDNEVVNKEYLKKIMDNINQNILKTKEDIDQITNIKIEKTRKDIAAIITHQLNDFSEKIEKTKQDLSEKIEKTNEKIEKTNPKISIENKKKLDEIENKINSGKLLNILEKNKNDYCKVEHLNIRTRSGALSFIPSLYDEITALISKSSRGYSKPNECIFMPGEDPGDTKHSLKIMRSIPESCTIFLVFTNWGSPGVVEFIHSSNKSQSLSTLSIQQIVNPSIGPQNLYLGKKYSVVIKIEKYHATNLRLTNPKSAGVVSFSVKNPPVNQILVGRGRGYIYDFLIYPKILDDNKINEIVSVLNHVHKVPENDIKKDIEDYRNHREIKKTK